MPVRPIRQQRNETQGRSEKGSGLRRPAPSPAARCDAELLAVLSYDRRRRFQANADGTPVIDESALGGNAFDDVFGG